jgi:multidrug resistance protein
VEFIALIALMMALTALSIDIMLPALPAIGAALGVADPNDRQTIIISYVLGFSVGQLAYGRLSDRYGRKPVLMLGLAVFVAGSLVASLSSSFVVLLAARTVQGLGAAAPRVIAIAIVRDLYTGRQMARIMSFAMMVFILIPVLAPSLGQGLLEVGTWRWTFDTLLLVGLIVAGWTALRLPETKEEGAGGAPLSLGASLKLALQTPQTLGYAIGAGFIFGCLMSYVSSAQQVFVDVFHLGANFPIAFGAIASLMALAALTNAPRRAYRHAPRLAHGTDGLCCGFRRSCRCGGFGPRDAAAVCGADERPVLSVRFDRAKLQCIGDGAAGAQRRHGVLADRLHDDRRRRGVRGHRRAPVQRHRSAAGAGLLVFEHYVLCHRAAGGGFARALPPGAVTRCA